VKLVLKIKLLPTAEQAALLLETCREATLACNAISEVAWEKRIFNKFKLHYQLYDSYIGKFELSSQMLVRAFTKVAYAYKLDKKTKRAFSPLGSITYDARIMTYKQDNMVSLWCIGGRQNIRFICHNPNYIPYIKGEADLVYKKGKFFLYQTVDIPEPAAQDIAGFIGVDFGLTDITVTSDGDKHPADWINQYREKRQKVRSSIQSKGTRNSKRLSKRLSGKERTTSAIINHTISKSIVKSAKDKRKGIAIENLTNIRFTSKHRNKKFRTKLGRWSFGQLRSFLEYKCRLNGVKLIVVEPNYTSQTCNCCRYIGKRTNKVFKCTNINCKVDVIDADFNAAQNIALLGAVVNLPERCDRYSCTVHY